MLGTGELRAVDSWLRSVLWEGEVPGTSIKQDKIEIHRLKARLIFDDGSMKIVQGVREIFEIVDGETPTPESSTTLQTGKIVLIGRGIHGVNLEQSFLDMIDNKDA